MYIEKSRYRQSLRVRIVCKVLVSGAWKKQIIQHIGTARHELDIALLTTHAEQVLAELRRGEQLALSFVPPQKPSQLVRTGEYWQLADLALGYVYDRIGLTPDLPLLRSLVIARVVFPASKRKTAGFLTRALATPCQEDQLYRAMDSLADQQTAVLKQVRRYITAAYPNSIGYVLYDVTTLYFERDEDDEPTTDSDGVVQPALRKKGYSKDHRGDLPQVVLGLAVNTLGMPLSYQLHSGDTYEGHTLISGIDATLDVLDKTDLTVVADAGMLSSANLLALEERGLHYIVGARLRSLSQTEQQEVLDLKFTRKKTIRELVLGNRRVVVSYSAKRAERAKKLRDKSVARLERLIAKNTAVRKHSYLAFTVKGKPSLNQSAIDATARWDGLKGYVTNQPKDTVPASDVIAHYTSLFRVEQSFRLYKSDVAVRPAFHYKPERIQAHVMICMLALTVMRILEQEMRPLGLTLDQSLQELIEAKAAVLKLNNQSFTVPPAYNQVQTKILARLTPKS